MQGIWTGYTLENKHRTWKPAFWKLKIIFLTSKPSFLGFHVSFCFSQGMFSAFLNLNFSKTQSWWLSHPFEKCSSKLGIFPKWGWTYKTFKSTTYIYIYISSRFRLVFQIHSLFAFSLAPIPNQKIITRLVTPRNRAFSYMNLGNPWKSSQPQKIFR